MINIYKELAYRDKESFMAVETLIMSLDLGPQKQLVLSQFPNWVNIAKDYIKEHWNKHITLEELSNLCAVHKVTISKYFEKYAGSTVLLYQRKIRIIRAVELMHFSGYSLTEIAFLCGFSDQSHFTRYFRQMIGFLPKELQKN
ncbi:MULTISPECIES: helix-turn-helix transcriptional regulator [Sphingobacterium]|uniref:helix-turn-helix transcriptional regulator n=1 Tax=Sphingobacterium TaxID=28453 RepID=UPI001623BE3A|nr:MULTISPECIES: AraC family transcriptional regulator [Sphingobacterium]MBV2226723.1 AraC family transcriptional regulator [Sphingobacterium mizutaii]